MEKPQYLVTKEKHEEKGVHLHIYLEFDRMHDITSRELFHVDLNYGNDYLNLKQREYFKEITNSSLRNEHIKEYQGNYQSAKAKKKIIKYILKDQNSIDECLTNMKIPFLNGQIIESPLEHINTVFEEQGLTPALDLLYMTYPLLAATRGSSIQKNFKQMSDYRQKREANSERIIKTKSLNCFTNVPEGINEWIDSDMYKEKSLLIHGSSGTGKTELAKSIFKSMKASYIFCSNKESLKEFNNATHDAILFDGIDISSLTKEEKISLFDIENDREIRILYGSAFIRAHCIKIFTTNNKIPFITDTSNLATNEIIGLKRRLFSVEVKEPMHNKQIIFEKTTTRITYNESKNDNNLENHWERCLSVNKKP